ncbi:glycosyl transferase [Tuber borchii]|uniref:Alpha-1,3-glucosyltransferase n=1 Tax=Tuber borchii TaxID=42251 RepID=A0A2T7A9C3_TUBBO|nr:glycosyl transferase [Tuber borchii]
MSSPQQGAYKPRMKKPKATRSVSFSLPALPFPLASFLHPLRSASSQWLVLPVLLMVSILFRWAVGLGPYSGMAAPPMHGDFEAQRHWMEVTTNLPAKEWYWHDLEWWGLDYPPLTAYHSWLLGVIGGMINPDWFALFESRGLDDVALKTFMRATALASELLTYVPAVVIFVRVFGRQADLSKYDKGVALAAILMQPALMIIDHGHFQYNSVMLGFTLFAVDCFITDHIYWGSFFFVLSLSFKQMALYYAPVIFAYLLGLCVHPNINIPRLVLLGATVIVSFGLVFAPLVFFGGKEQIAQCLFRVFPFARGLWEDKVANFWCAANILVKFRERFDSGMLQKASLVATLVAILPPCLILFFNPQKRLLPLGLAACAWGFFMFSFQVHEKSVLLPLVPTTLVLAGSLDKNTVSWVSWMNNVAMFSMWPLLRRDGLQLQYTVLALLYAWLMGTFKHLPKHWFGKLVHVGSYISILATHFAEAFLFKGLLQKFPDLWVVVNVEISFGCFTVAWIWVLWRLWKESRKGRKKPKRE